MADFTSAPVMESPSGMSTSSPAASSSSSAPVTTTIYLSTVTTANSYPSSPSSLSSLSSEGSTATNFPSTSDVTSSTLLTSVSATNPSGSVSSPMPTTTPSYWGWACNSTNGSLSEHYSSLSGAACQETFAVPSSTKININLTEPTATGNNSEPTRTFTPGAFPGAAPRGIDASFGGVAGWAGLMMVVGFWIGLF